MKAKKSLAETHPEIAKQWHPTKNADLTPNEVTKGSGKRVWWKCDKGDDHEWQTKVVKRTDGGKCPVCSGRKIVKSNSLAVLDQELSKQWHPTKNGDLTPFDVTLNSGKKVWWKCDKGDDHEWIASPNTRDRTGCPMCSGKAVSVTNSLFSIRPDLSKQWHPTKNGKLTPKQIVSQSNKKVWWKCDKGDDHEWIASPNTRDRTGCPVCAGHKIVKSNSLHNLFPEISKQWHPNKNGDLTANDISAGSSKKVWWQCNKGPDHEWKASPNDRTTGHSCPVCSGKKVVLSNSLATVNPKLSKQWHPTLNGILTPKDVTEKSAKKIWWKCDKVDDHVWRTTIGKRSEGQECPYCTLTPQSKQELTITFELIKLFKNIDPKGLKTRLDGRLRAIDIFIPKLNLCIEFDGSYWHKNKRDLDKIKSEMIFEKGFKLIRVREEPLEKIYDADVISKQPYDGKQVTNNILSTILSMFDLDAEMVSKIKKYQSKDTLQNEIGLEKYIDKILIEKSNK